MCYTYIVTVSGFVLIVASNVSKLVAAEVSIGSELSRVRLIVEYLSLLDLLESYDLSL